MPRKQSTTEKLLAVSSSAPPIQTSPQSSDFIKKMIFQPDQKQAASMVRDHATSQFMQGEGAELKELEQLKSDADKRLKHSESALNELQNAQNKTPRYIKYRELSFSPSDVHPDKVKSGSFLSWELSDQLTGGFLFICLCVVMVMSGANVYANLMASGERAFLEQPWLAVCISALAPCASASFKMLASAFDYQSSKKQYALGVHVLTLIITLAWTVAFAMNFTGASGALDLDAMMDGDGGKGAALVWLQLVCEILVGASLFLALGEIALKYSPFIFTENPDHINITKALKTHKEEHERLCEKSSEIAKKIIRLESAKDVFINERLADFGAFVSKFNSLNQF